MKIIDLSHLMENGMPVYPGDEIPNVQKALTHDKDGAQVIRLSISTHTGTHLDTPRHFFGAGATTDLMDPGNFIGKAVLVDCTAFAQHQQIQLNQVINYREALEKADFALIYTGWGHHWGTAKYFGHFPVLSIEAVEFLVSTNLKGIGLDFPSIDGFNSKEYPNHKLVLGQGMIIIENLTNLGALVDETFQFAAFPLKIKEGDGSPVRAVAIVEAGEARL
jgi:kynurenine formamidase